MLLIETLQGQLTIDTAWRRCIGCLILKGHFPQNNPIFSGSFAKRNLQLKAFYASTLLKNNLLQIRLLHKRCAMTLGLTFENCYLLFGV